MRHPQVLLALSPAMNALLAEAEAIASTDSKVLITGESGVGKELLAGFIHRHSRRSRLPMLAINCAGVPESLLESELFGHVRGSFTGAHQNRRGMLEAAHLGTLLLDEVGEMSLRMQGILLRFLENGEIQRIGSDRPQMWVDVRLIAATNRVLIDAVQRKEFREDLFYRLNIVHLIVPPLRERVEDIKALLHHFITELTKATQLPAPEFTPEAWRALLDYHWPGNVRQLRNVVERLLVTRAGRRVTEHDLGLPTTTLEATPTAAPAPPSTAEICFRRLVDGHESFWTVIYEPFMARDLTRDVVREVVRTGLRQTKGNYRLVSQLFNLSPGEYKRFLSFLQKYDCHMPFKHFRFAAASLQNSKEGHSDSALTA
jgi:transcriptional regulator with PAS, ATPase and Fis domain